VINNLEFIYFCYSFCQLKPICQRQKAWNDLVQKQNPCTVTASEDDDEEDEEEIPFIAVYL
jgi:hypothetical protein